MFKRFIRSQERWFYDLNSETLWNHVLLYKHRPDNAQCWKVGAHSEYSQNSWYDQNYLSWSRRLLEQLLLLALDNENLNPYLPSFTKQVFWWWEYIEKSVACFNFQPWVASSSTKSKASSFVTQSTCDTWLKWDVNININPKETEITNNVTLFRNLTP